MNIVRMILKEAGGRAENAAGAINSKDNMFAGSSGNAVSDKIGMGSEDNNPIKTAEGTETDTTTVETTTTPEVETSDTTSETETFSDEKLKDYNDYKKNFGEQSASLKGRLQNLDFSPLKPTTSNDSSSSGSGGIGAMSNMFKGIMGASGESGNADMGADAGDMGDMADMADSADSASDERLKNIFGDNEDAIKAFAKINAIEFTYNDKAHDIPGGENKGIDDDVHYGVKAQEIAENPLTASAVKRDPISDYLTIDVKELTTANTAIISEICKRLLIIEKVLGIKVV